MTLRDDGWLGYVRCCAISPNGCLQVVLFLAELVEVGLIYDVSCDIKKLHSLSFLFPCVLFFQSNTLFFFSGSVVETLELKQMVK